MLINCFNHRDFEFYAEERLIFEFPKGKKGPRRKPKKKDEETMAGTTKALDELNRKIKAKQRRKEKESEFPETHTRRLDTRDDLEERRLPDESIAEELDRIAQREGLKDSNEIRTITLTHDVISRHYMDPAFMLFLDTQMQSQAPRIYEGLNLVLQNPYLFDYVYDNTTGSVTITETAPHDPNGPVPKGFKLLIESDTSKKRGFISEVNGVSLKGSAGHFPWESVDFLAKMKDYQDKFDYEWNYGTYNKLSYQPGGAYYERYLNPDPNARIDDAEFQRRLAQEQLEGLKNVTTETRETFLIMNVTIPLRLMQLIEARNYDFEQQHPRVVDLMTGTFGTPPRTYRQQLEELHALMISGKDGFKKAYERMTQNRDTEYRVWCFPDKDDPNVFRISTDSWPNSELVIDRNGYITDEDADWNHIPDPRYKHKMRRGYYISEATPQRDENATAQLVEGQNFPTYQREIQDAQTAGAALDARRNNERRMIPLENELITRLEDTYDQAEFVQRWNDIKDAFVLSHPPAEQAAARAQIDQYDTGVAWAFYQNPQNPQLQVTTQRQYHEYMRDLKVYYLHAAKEKMREDPAAMQRVANRFGVQLLP